MINKKWIGIESLNKQLKHELIKLTEEDQQLIEKLSASGELAKYKDEVHPELRIIFERNTARAKEIINEYGWPTITLVGDEGSDAMYLIVQHSVLDEIFMQDCVSTLEEAVNKKEAKSWQLAFLQDRTLMQQNKPQIYGTQHITTDDNIVKPYRILEPETVNERRKNLGLEPLEERTKHLQENSNRIIKAQQERSKK